MRYSHRHLTDCLNIPLRLRLKAVSVVASSALAVALSISIPAQAEDDPFHKTGFGLSVNIGLIPAPAIQGRPAGDPMAPMPGGPVRSYKFHLVVAVFDAATRERITDASVKARVSEIGLAGREITLEKMQGTDPVSYGGLVGFPSNGRYVIAVEIKRPSSPSVSFDFAYEKQAQ